MFSKLFRIQIDGTPIHIMRDSGLYPAISVLAERWQAKTGFKCPFRASKLWPKELAAGIAFAVFFFVVASNYPGGWILVTSFIFFNLACLRIVHEHKSLDVDSAKRFAELVCELDDELRTMSASGLFRLSEARDSDKIEGLLKKELAELTRFIVFCEHEKPSNVSVWREKRNHLGKTSRELGFDLGSYESYHQEAEERYRRDNSPILGNQSSQ